MVMCVARNLDSKFLRQFSSEASEAKVDRIDFSFVVAHRILF